jgi:tetratricopeptide (TPR) repeat protein
MSFLALRAGELPTARQHLEAMIAAGHDGYSVRLRLGRLAARQDQRQEALKHYNQALIFFPRGAEAYRELARLHEGTPAREQLAESLRQITELDQSDFDTALRLSRLERELGELPLARRAATRALHIRPFSLEAQTQAGALALEEGDGDEAAARYKVALLLARGGDAQERAGLHLGLARALVISGDKPKARAAIQEAAALAPQHPMLEEVRALAR